MVAVNLADITRSYVCSRIYLHDPPGQDQDDVFLPHPEIPAEALRKERELAEAEPDVNPWACLVLLVVTVALMGVTAEFVRLPVPLLLPAHPCSSLLINRDPSPQLVDSIQFVLTETKIKEECALSLPFSRSQNLHAQSSSSPP